MVQVTPIFPSFLVTDTLDIDTGAIADCCYDLMQRDAGRKLSNDGGYQSGKLDFELAPVLKNLSNQIVERVNGLHVALMLNNVLEQRLSNAWFNINRKGDYNIPHVHPRSCFSGVFYVKAPKDCGDLYLKNPAVSLEHVITDIEIQQYNAFTSPSLRVAAEPGKLVLFPSWVLHFVKANQSDSDRISIAFNTVFQRGNAAQRARASTP